VKAKGLPYWLPLVIQAARDRYLANGGTADDFSALTTALLRALRRLRQANR
jgi:hypothetical protein